MTRWLILLLLFTAPMLSPAQGLGEQLRAEFIVGDTPVAPAAADPRWHPVDLPHRLARLSTHSPGGWYRLRVQVPVPPEQVQGIYLWRLHLNAAVYFNGHFLGDGGTFEEPIARNWNHPLYFTVPPTLWRAGENEILIRLKTRPGWGMLSPVSIGPESELKPRHQLRHFFQVELSAAFSLTLAVAGGMVLAIWWRRRQDRAYFWFGLACLLWSVYAAYLFVRNPVIPGDSFRWLALASLDGWVYCLALFAHRYLHIEAPRFERGYFFLLAGGLGLTLILPVAEQSMLFRLLHLASLLVVVGLALEASRRWRASRHREAGLLMAALWALALAGTHDTVLNLPFAWVTLESMRASMRFQFYLLSFTAPLVLFFLIGHLARRFIHGLNEAERMNLELESRVSQAQQALEIGYRERRELELQRAAGEERERIYQDLHDDIGAKLLSLAIGAENPQQADTARSALQELRDVVSHSGREETPLSYLLADWRAESERRMSAAGLVLTWRQEDSDLDPLVTSIDSLNLTRILREALSNVLRHAEAGRVDIHIEFADAGLQISVADDGKGCVDPGARGGRGTRNMLARTQRLGGEIRWGDASPRGCRVVWRVPLAGLGRSSAPA